MGLLARRPPAPAVHQVALRAMGTSVAITVQTDEQARAERLVRDGVARVQRLESLWSRFLPSSDISRVNRSPAIPVEVDHRTLAIVRLAVEASVATGGAFSPLVGASMIANGYRQGWQSGWAGYPQGAPADAPVAAPSIDDVRIDTAARCISVAPGVALDLGGIAKGHAADLVAVALQRAGASSVCVDLGGDVRVLGDAVWDIDVEDPFDETSIVHTWTISDGAVATSSRLRRRWRAADGTERHHLVDPRTGAPTSGPAAVSVLAGRGADAEVLTKVAMVRGVAALDRWLGNGIEVLAIDGPGVLTASQPSAQGPALGQINNVNNVNNVNKDWRAS